MIKLSIECWIYLSGSDQFLLLRCPVTRRHNEYWQPVTGGRLAHEDCVVACLREVEEETGIVLDAARLETVIPEFSFCIPDARMELRKPVYLARVETPDVRISEEHIGYSWFAADQIDRHLHWDSNRESFRRVLGYLRENPL